MTLLPPSTVDVATLRQALAAGLGQEVVALDRRPSVYSSSYRLEDVDVRLADGTALALVLKDLSSSALLADARGAKPPFLYDPRREIAVYRTVLAGRGLGTAACHAAFADDAGHAWLALEKVDGVELYQVGEIEVWEEAARWLATLHAALAADAERLAGPALLLRHDVAYYRRWLERARAHAVGSSDAEAALAWLAERHERVVARLVELPRTIIHGEAYASNVLVQPRADGSLRVCPVDWEMAALGPGLMDLAALTAGGWSVEQRRQVGHAYFGALGSGDPGPADWAALDCCRLQIAVQWLGWARDWRAPEAHAQDWLAEALDAARSLGL